MLAWLTDLHLNFCDDETIKRFLITVASEQVDGLLLSGDISDAPNLHVHLEAIETQLQIPVYFVLGNHDFYHSGFGIVRNSIQELCKSSEHLHWLPDCDVISLAGNVGLVGVDGWADGRLGNFAKSPVELNDFHQINELVDLARDERLQKLNGYGDEAADEIRTKLRLALEQHDTVILVTHVPPFRNAAWHEGEVSNDDFLPFFASEVAGKAIQELMSEAPEKTLLVLCGHTHGQGVYRPSPNVLVLTGAATYCRPEVQRIVDPATVTKFIRDYADLK